MQQMILVDDFSSLPPFFNAGKSNILAPPNKLQAQCQTAQFLILLQLEAVFL